MKKIMTLCLALAAWSLNAQTWQWARTEAVNAEGNAMCTDSQGNVFLTGNTYSSGVIGTNTLTAQGNAYLVKYNSSGTVLWVRSFAFASNNQGNSYGVATDNAGNVFITGTFGGTMVVGSNTFVTYTAPNNAIYFDMFIVKYDAAGNLLWAQTYSGANVGHEIGYSACTDASGNLIIAGSYSSPTLTLGSSTLTNVSSYSKYFVAKFNGNGTPLWAKAPLPYGMSQAYNIDMDNNGNLFICGAYQQSLAVGGTTLSSSGISDYNYFIAKYDASGNFQWVQGGGGTQNDQAFAVDDDGSGGVYLTGGFYTPSMVVGTNTLTSAGSVDAFVTRYNSSGSVLWSKNIGSNGAEIGRVVRAKGNGFLLAGDVAPFGTCTLVIGSTPIVPNTISTTWLAEFDGSGNPLGFVTSDKGSGGNAGLTFNPLCMLMDYPCRLYLGGDFQNQTVLGTYTLNATVGAGFSSPFVARMNLPSANVVTLSVSGNQPICAGKSATLVASGAGTFTWTNGPTTNTYVVTPGNATTYTVSGGAVCASNSAVVTVSVNPNPTISITKDPSPFCIGSITTLTAQGASTYSWSTGDLTPVITTTLIQSNTYSVVGTNTLTGCSAATVSAFFAALCEGVAEESGLGDVKIYPNPTSDFIHLEIGKNPGLQIDLKDALGHVVLEKKNLKSSEWLDLTTLPRGIYFMRIQNESQKKVVKIIKE